MNNLDLQGFKNLEGRKTNNQSLSQKSDESKFRQLEGGHKESGGGVAVGIKPPAP